MKKRVMIALAAFLCASPPAIAATTITSQAPSQKAEHPLFGRAKWITSDKSQSATNTWLVYRKTFNVDAPAASMTARIAAESKYWLWINDSLVVFEGGLKRGPAPDATYYDSVEIGPLLNRGENTIAVLVWYFGKDGFSHVDSGKAGLLFAASAPGVEIVSDGSWGCNLYGAYQNTTAPYPNYRLSESNIRFDARDEIARWNKRDFDGALHPAIGIAAAGELPFGKLVERPIPQWKNSGILPYLAVRRSPRGDTLYCTLPYNCHATPYLKVNAPAGQTIHILTDNYAGGSELNLRAEYVTRPGVQEYESLGWMNGHQMWYVIPPEVEVLDVGYRETGYDAELTGSFRCSDTFLDELWRRSARTLYVTMRDNYMDCPDRERAQWWGDEVNELGEAFYALSRPAQRLAVKGIHELMNWQRADGVILSPVPAGNYFGELPLQMLASVGWYGFHTQYFYSTDAGFVPAIYDRMRRYLHEVWQTDAEGLAIPRAGGWNWGDWGDNVDLGVLTNCWYYLALKGEREFAAMLGKSGDVERIEQMMGRMKRAFDGHFWRGTSYRSPDYTGADDDRSQAMAVLSGLAPKSRYPALVKVLRREHHASPYMEKYVLESLFEMGEPALALDRMKRRYAPMLAYDNYTTLFEGWGIGSEGFGGGTIDHAWSGGPLTLLSQKVCGVEPTSPGFSSFRITPQLAGLTWAETVVPTSYGDIEVSLRRKGARLDMQVTVPEGTRAEVVYGGKTVALAAGRHKLTR